MIGAEFNVRYGLCLRSMPGWPGSALSMIPRFPSVPGTEKRSGLSAYRLGRFLLRRLAGLCRVVRMLKISNSSPLLKQTTKSQRHKENFREPTPQYSWRYCPLVVGCSVTDDSGRA